MQYNQIQLIKKIEQVPYVYFLKAIKGDQELGKVVITLDRDIQEYKALKTLYIGFSDTDILSQLMIQTVKWVEKYQNAFQMHFPFFLPSGNIKVKQYITNLQSKFTSSLQSIPQQLSIPVILSKQIYSNISQTRFIFKRKHKNVNFYPNRYPVSINFKISLLHSENKLCLQRADKEKYSNKIISYDLLLAELIRKTLKDDEIKLLKQKQLGQQRFKKILSYIMMNSHKNTPHPTPNPQTPSFKALHSSNISQLHTQLSKQNNPYPFMQLSDIVKTQNSITYLSYSYCYKLKYPIIKSIREKNKQMYYKITINEEVYVKRYKYSDDEEETVFYRLKLISQRSNIHNNNVQQQQQKYLILFDSSSYLKHINRFQDLSTYILESVSNNSLPYTSILISNLFIPMSRYPSLYSQRQELFLSTHKLNDFKLLKQELFIGQFFQFFCDMQIQNGIKYQINNQNDKIKKKKQIIINKSLGIVIIGKNSEKIIYGRVFE